MASLTRNPRGQLRTPGVRTAPTGPRPRITRAPPPGRTCRPVPTRARQGRRCNEIHRKPARGQRPGKPHPTRPSAGTKEERHPAGTTATTTPSMPSWTPAGMTPRRSQHRRRHASTRSRNATRRTIRPSRSQDKRTSSATTPLWGRLSQRARGRRPRAARRTGLRTIATPQVRARAWKRPATPRVSLSAHRRGPPRPGGGDTWTRHACRVTRATPANKQSKKRPKT